jgi:hypothetical protein
MEMGSKIQAVHLTSSFGIKKPFISVLAGAQHNITVDNSISDGFITAMNGEALTGAIEKTL